MRVIRQKHTTGCGVAALAMAVGTSYDKMLQTLHPKRKPRACACTTMVDDLKALEKMGVNYRVSFRKRSLTNIKNDAMVVVKSRWGGLHAVAWDAQKQEVIDPWAPYGKRKLKVVIDPVYCKKNLAYLIEIIK
jgi:ABC-type bacteriocin/lantibiotic exporter with double-glycine peptidase domain